VIHKLKSSAKPFIKSQCRKASLNTRLKASDKLSLMRDCIGNEAKLCFQSSLRRIMVELYSGLLER
jgi:hypothetical protein